MFLFKNNYVPSGQGKTLLDVIRLVNFERKSCEK